VKTILLAVVFVSCVTPSVFAQTKGRVGIGGGYTFNATTDSGVGTGNGLGVILRLNPRPGWGASGTFNWFNADLSNPSGSSGEFAELHIKPLLGGVSYAIEQGKVLTSFSLVGGPSFNSVSFDDVFTRSSVAAIDVNNSFAVRAGVGVNYTLRSHVALVGFGGYLFDRPDVTYRDSSGREFHDQWHADAVVIAIGAVYSFF
jgi:hypothetical protein